ncbi:MAG: heme-binding protein, partial [Acidobacteriota bacterium]|nr:heme-binding protein [Acidobacteriota bacterium]
MRLRCVNPRAIGVRHIRLLIFLLTALASIFSLIVVTGRARGLVTPTAPMAAPVLVTQANSTRAIALDSVTESTEPFALNERVAFGADDRTRVMLFALNLPVTDAGAVTSEAEDGALFQYPLTVEYVGVVPGFPWMSAVVVRLNDNFGDVGDVLVGITYQGLHSNRVRVGIGHVGDGPPDDAGAIPTPGTTAPPIQPAGTAGTLSTSDVQTIIAQAVSTASQLNRPVTVAVTDREANVLAVFKMTGAPTSTQFRGGGPGPSQVPNPLTGFVPVGLDGTVVPAKLAAISKAGTASLFSTRGNAFT